VQRCKFEQPVGVVGDHDLYRRVCQAPAKLVQAGTGSLLVGECIAPSLVAGGLVAGGLVAPSLAAGGLAAGGLGCVAASADGVLAFGCPEGAHA
jgi:hypothetical protein